jgi:hypothetical protein
MPQVINCGCASDFPKPSMPQGVDCRTQAPRSIPPGVLDIGVAFHLMRASNHGISSELRKSLLDKEPRWKLAADPDAVAKVWTAATIDVLFGPYGVVNTIWGDAKIHLSPRLIENCYYTPQQLRLDGRRRESMITPESRIPWAPALFHSVNRLFLRRDPRVIHVLIWWSLVEEDSTMVVQGYARSAAHGGPAVWVDTHQCFGFHDEWPFTQDSVDYNGCGRLLAHEIGHAFGLQHVDADTNLMHQNHTADSLTRMQRERARREAKQQFLRE